MESKAPDCIISRPMRRQAQAFGLALTLVVISAVVHAQDCVKPSEDVVTGVILRKAPSTASDRLGSLRPGNRLEVTSAVAGWTQVKTDDGQAAYVSKRWTDVVPCGGMELAAAPSTSGPFPLIAAGRTVDWWFVFKQNAVAFPGCGSTVERRCPFGGTVPTYKAGMQFAFASSAVKTLAQGRDCIGTTLEDPVGATFDEIYHGSFNYVVWNDQFHGDPSLPFPKCSEDCDSPWGHSKGMVAWNDAGDGVVMQVTTPSWPGAGNDHHPRPHDGNTLGCELGNNVKFSQHFFALHLTRDDLLKVILALVNASVATDPANPQLVKNGGPSDIQAVVQQLGRRSSSVTATVDTLSSGVRMISKPSKLNVPPWQMVSALLGGVPLRTATWWASPYIPSTLASDAILCWSSALPPPGDVEIATTGSWGGTTIGLKGLAPNGNHAKIGVTTDATSNLSIFGDLNQQGALSESCSRSQNGRGGLFFVVHDAELSKSVAALIEGASDR